MPASVTPNIGAVLALVIQLLLNYTFRCNFIESFPFGEYNVYSKPALQNIVPKKSTALKGDRTSKPVQPGGNMKEGKPDFGEPIDS